MDRKKILIILITFALLAASSLTSSAKTRVYTSVSVAGVIGGGVYWYFSVGTQVSKRGSNHGYALLPRLYSSQPEFHPAFESKEAPEEELTLYLPLYSIKF